MPQFLIKVEWQDSPRARAPELSATWARLEILIDNVPVTKVEDHRAQAVRNGIYVPLYPIAEWLAANWWFLWNEWRVDCPEARHNLLAAREGFALPDLSFLPTESRMQLVWRPRPAGEIDRVAFLTGGAQTLPKNAVLDEVRGFIEAVIQRLEARDAGPTYLAGEWQAIRDAEEDPERRRFCEQAARLGVDAFQVDSSLAAGIEELDDLLPGLLLDDFCAAITPGDIPPGVEAVNGFLAHLDEGRTTGAGWARHVAAVEPANGLPPWQYGYTQARALRLRLGIGDQTGTSLDSILDLPVDPFDAPPGIEAIAAPDRAREPRFGLPSRVIRPESRRFVLCRALSEYLAGGAPSLVTRTQSERQQRNRAFAAEFLAPAALIRERLGGGRVSEDDLEYLAQEFGVSGFVIRRQVENHRLAAIV